LVTGAGRGIGRGIALGLAQAGARVALLARSGDELDRTASQVLEHGGHALAVPADVSDPGQLTGAVQRTRDELGDVSVPHTVNLAAELDGTGVTVNAFRPGSVDTAMQAWIRGQYPAQVGAELHRRFTAS
jgi:NAD(P)-dependent dehydrogenase (short-subunit alcohol dehydrogenase family)